MPGFFEALSSMPKKNKKKHVIVIEGNEHEVDLETKIWARRHGEENLILKEGKIIVKKKPYAKTSYKILAKSQMGYGLLDDDIHWPMGIIKGGVTWQRK